MSRKLFALLGFCLLSGCVQYAWIKPNATAQDLGKDKYTCLQSAAMTAPPVVGVAANSSRTENAKRSDANATVYATDLNQNTRDQLFNACMESKGWSLQLLRTDGS